MTVDRNCISYWLPRLQATGVPTPRTEIIRTKLPLMKLLDGETPEGWDEFIAKLTKACNRVSYPCFLRTGHGSGKHDWKDTCYIKAAADLPHHVSALVEWCAMVDMIGLPTDVWAVRRLLPTQPLFMAFRELPICRERRYFLVDGKVKYHIPYWPEDAFEHTKCSMTAWRSLLLDLNRESKYEAKILTEESTRVAKKFKRLGNWSLDWLWTTRGWYAIDMAKAEDSWGWKK